MQEGEPTKKPKRAAKPIDRPDDVPEGVWNDWVAQRNRKSAPVTATAMNGIRKQAVAAGIPLAEALSIALTRGWQSFQASWLTDRNTNGRGPAPRRRFDEEHIDLPILTE